MSAGAGLDGVPSASTPVWKAGLELGYRHEGDRTVLARRKHQGPLLVQKPFYPEGHEVCHTLLIHPPGGIVGGDALRLRIELAPKSQVVVTTPGATKWYRSNATFASCDFGFELTGGACLEWLPQEAIVFDGARANLHTHVMLAPESRYLGWEITCFGRTAANERFESGAYRQRTEIFLAGKQIWGEYGNLNGGDNRFRSRVGLDGFSVVGTFTAAGLDFSSPVVDAGRAVVPRSGRAGLTQLPHLLVARYLGPSAEDARKYFIGIWSVLRPWLVNRVACPPRIWNT